MTSDSMKQLAEDANQDVQRKEFELLQVLENNDNAFLEYLKKQGDGRRPFSISEMSFNLSLCLEGTLLKSYRKTDAFVSMEYPVEATREGLWKLVCEWNCPIIVSLDQPDDKPIYWPESGSVNQSGFIISCNNTTIKTHYTIRQLDVRKENEENAVMANHVQFTNGTARGNIDAFVELIKEVSGLQKATSTTGPTVVHSSDGGGLCGIFVAVLSEIERLQDSGKCDVFKTVRQLKETNDKILDAESDYCLCYKMLFNYLQQGSQIYQNL